MGGKNLLEKKIMVVNFITLKRVQKSWIKKKEKKFIINTKNKKIKKGPKIWKERKINNNKNFFFNNKKVEEEFFCQEKEGKVPFEEISLWSELSSQRSFRIQGVGMSGRTKEDGNPRV